MLRILPLLILLITFVSCSSDNGLLDRMNNFDQGPMLSEIGGELIVPAYRSLSDRNSDLKTSIADLVQNPSVALLQEARISLKSARLEWQRVTPYQFGPSEQFGLSSTLNTYPVDVNQIERNIQEGQYDLNTLANSDAKGYQALGYLLYTPDLTDQEIVNAINGARAQYLLDVSTQIAVVSLSVYEAWSPEGQNYLGTFASADAEGVDAGSSIARLVNAMNMDFERNTRDGKVGIPVGIRTLGEPILNAVEAYYAGYSVELLQANLEAYARLYHGNDADGISFDDYLKAIEATTTQNEELSKSISNQFTALLEEASKLGDPLQQQIVDDKAAVETVFVEMQRLVVLFKTDMASALGVVITYQDNDGD